MNGPVSCPYCAFYAANEGTLCPAHEPPPVKKCPGCGHPRHPETCTVRLPWWRRWILKECSCHYWDARWDDKVVDYKKGTS